MQLFKHICTYIYLYVYVSLSVGLRNLEMLKWCKIKRMKSSNSPYITMVSRLDSFGDDSEMLRLQW